MAPSKKNYQITVEDGEIDLSMLDIQEVPVKDIAKKKAHSLDLSNNHISVLPNNFGTLVQLTKLDLSKNQLTELPETFGDLVKLKYLDLYKNELQSLPLSFSNLKALKWLDLKDNPLLPVIGNIAGPCLEEKQCQKCAKDIVAFYANLQVRVTEEKSVRDQQRQRDLELNAQKQKVEQKKGKKNKKSKNKEIVKEAVPLQQNKKTKKSSVKDAQKVAQKSSTSIIFNLFKYLFYATILLCSTIFVLTAAQVTCMRGFEAEVLKVWTKCIDTLPPSYQGYGVQVGETIRRIHVLTGNGVVIAIQYFGYLRKNESVNIIVTEFTHLFQNVTRSASELYVKVFG